MSRIAEPKISEYEERPSPGFGRGPFSLPLTAFAFGCRDINIHRQQLLLCHTARPLPSKSTESPWLPIRSVMPQQGTAPLGIGRCRGFFSRRRCRSFFSRRRSHSAFSTATTGSRGTAGRCRSAARGCGGTAGRSRGTATRRGGAAAAVVVAMTEEQKTGLSRLNTGEQKGQAAQGRQTKHASKHHRSPKVRESR